MINREDMLEINRNEPRLQKQLDGQNTHRILFRRFGVESAPI